MHQILIEAKTDKKLQNTINCGKEGNRIRELYPDMIQPRQHDYLGISKFSNKSSETKAELRSEEFEQSSSLDFCRSMADIGRIKRTKDSDQGLYPKGSKCAKGFFTSNAFFPWQYYDGISPFNKDEVVRLYANHNSFVRHNLILSCNFYIIVFEFTVDFCRTSAKILVC